MKTSLVILAFSAVLPALAQRPDLEKLKSEVVAEVEARRALTQQIVDSLFSFAELGFQEFETSAYLTAILEKEGFKVERGVAGMPTAFVASWGSGKPVIGFMADIDGLPATSQKPGIPWHEPLIEGGPGHGEGHNSGPALNITAAIAVKQVMQRHRLPGTIRVYPGVAEELLASRTYMVMAGLFRDVDAMLSCHVASEFSTSYGSRGSALVSTQFTFEGRSAHSAGSPWSGRSALDAVELMNAGWNFRREHLRPEQRSHYVIVDGGDQPNVVPPTATVWYFFRELDYDRIRELHEIGRRIAAGAAMMT
ncbi:MAG TPA: amidohydrolase, partial [Bryobacteraceae bacterium]|nr:amidohydrolase [Bryobacteraceae bacterium]